MNEVTVGFISLFALILLVTIGVRVAYAVALVGIVGLFSILGLDKTISLVGNIPGSIVGNYTYSTIVLFILMGYLAYHSKIADDLFETIRVWVQHIHGGLPASTILASAAFSTVSGSSSAASAVLGKMAIPKMLSSGVDKSLASGTVAMGGCIAVLIPPSTLIIIYGIMAEQSISSMLIAGIIPGIITVVIYLLFIYIRVRISPSLAPIQKNYSWKVRIQSLKKVVGILLLVILIIGGLFFGFFTPIEAAGVGAFGALIIGIVMKRLTFKTIKLAFLDTLKTSAMIFLIMVSISIFIRLLAYSGLTSQITSFIIQLPFNKFATLTIILLILLVLGMFMDAISMMMLTIPIILPVIVEIGFNPIWFGIVLIKMAEIGLVSPPVGLNCFIVQGVAKEIPLVTIFKGVLPFIILEILIVILFIVFPEIITFLPELMRK